MQSKILQAVARIFNASTTDCDRWNLNYHLRSPIAEVIGSVQRSPSLFPQFLLHLRERSM